jgi:hypothetical protein
MAGEPRNVSTRSPPTKTEFFYTPVPCKLDSRRTAESDRLSGPMSRR